MNEAALRERILQIADEAKAQAVAVAAYDFQRRRSWSLHGHRWFHAASTIKVPVLLAVFDAIHAGRFEHYSRVHVRNRFLSAVDGSPYRVDSRRDANGDVHAARGKTMMVRELAHHMIATSSNLATNLLLDVVGLQQAQATMARLGLRGIDLLRGVEDEAAWEADVNNRITAEGLCDALRMIEEGRAISPEASAAMLEILHQQRFKSGIPAGLPDDARVAHKTGEMSSVAHDGGIVYLGGRDAYVLVILTEWRPDTDGRQKTIARISRAVYETITAGTA
ncbi:MAG TPA: serine hydrolase [Candidatus Limnocylindrales bacterium]|nr:serine hydrolase [Candidatus Limnocylindrales bacterium]